MQYWYAARAAVRTPEMAPYTVADCSVAGLVPLPFSGLLPEEILTAYLGRLGAQRPAAPTKEVLAALLAAHVDCIAYLLPTPTNDSLCWTMLHRDSVLCCQSSYSLLEQV